MTMPGRSCVALTLLIVLCDPDWAGIDGSLESLLISEIPEGWSLPLHCSRNDSRHTGMKIRPSANVQYKGADSKRSIFGLLLRRAWSHFIPLSKLKCFQQE